MGEMGCLVNFSLDALLSARRSAAEHEAALARDALGVIAPKVP